VIVVAKDALVEVMVDAIEALVEVIEPLMSVAI
jgi:hypothetical protein